MNERQVDFQTFRMNMDERVTYSDFKNNRLRANILSICVSGAKSANSIAKVRFREGDELILWPGRVIHLSQPTTEAVFSWEAQTGEYLIIEYSDKVLFPSSDFANSNSLVSNIPSRISSRIVSIMHQSDLPFNAAQTLLVQSNPNRIKLKVESFCDRRVFIGSKENTVDLTANILLVEKCDSINPFQTKVFEHSDDIYAIIDDKSVGPSGALGWGAGLSLKITEYLK